MVFIRVASGKRRVVSFSEQEGLFTGNLEACVAIAGSYEGKGALVHATQRDNLGEHTSWFKEQIPTEGRVYLVGGMKGKAENFVAQIRGLLSEYNLKEEVLTPYHINMWLQSDKVDINLIRYHRMGNQIEPIIMDAHSI